MRCLQNTLIIANLVVLKFADRLKFKAWRDVFASDNVEMFKNLPRVASDDVLDLEVVGELESQ